MPCSARKRGFRHVLLALLVVCAFLPHLAGAGLAEDPAAGDGEAAAPDPPGQSYATGLTPVSADRYRSFQAKSRYRGFLPVRVDLARYFPAPGNQGNLGACTAWATGYAARSYYAVRAENRPRNSKADIPSPGYIYQSIKSSADCSGGSSIPDALDLLRTGSLSLRQYPYRASDCSTPTAEQKQRATDFAIDGAERVDYTVTDDLKGQIARGNPVVIGMSLTKQFFNVRGARIYSASGGDGTGNHAMVLIGYDDALQAFRVINSWGRGWGDGGYGWISYDTVRRTVNEAYVMDVRSPPPPAPDPIVKVDGLRCAKVREDSSGGRLRITGFVGSDSDLAVLRAAYGTRAQEFDVAVRPWPQCEVLQTLDEQLAKPERPRIETSADEHGIAGGDVLSLAVTSPGWPAYVYVNYVQADGTVVTLSQPPLAPPHPLARRSTQMFGDGKDGRARFVVGPPYGDEILVVLASRSPLFDQPLPATMDERDYLSRLRKAVLYKPDKDQPDRDVSAAVEPITTREK